MMEPPSYTFQAKVWLYSAEKGSWHFVTVPPELSETLKSMFGYMSAGWGSLPVNVTIGKTTWQTSIFPVKKSGSYFLPIKSDVRKKEHIDVDTNIQVTLTVRVSLVR